MPYVDNVTFTVTCTMRPRWVPHFLGMLKRMQYLGAIGSSRNTTIFADGDGDFRPKFEWSCEDYVPAEPVSDKGGNALFDAG